jgi:shikimate dehydrogenase
MNAARKAEPIQLAVFGMPVKHSLSPRIHTLFAQQGGLEVDYRAIEVEEEFFSREVQKLADAGGRGCNITLPLKHCAFKLANRASERAELARSANTLLFESPSRWAADSTDGPGLLRDLTENLGISIAGRRVGVIGAGGAAAGILYDLLQAGPGGLTLFNRTVGKAETLAEQFAVAGRVEPAGLEAMESSGAYDLVIDATSAGHQGTDPVLVGDMFDGGGICYDLNYGQAHESLGTWCAARGIPCHDGLGMLVEQAALSFRIWTGFMPDTAPVLAALRKG